MLAEDSHGTSSLIFLKDRIIIIKCRLLQFFFGDLSVKPKQNSKHFGTLLITETKSNERYRVCMVDWLVVLGLTAL